ncbi:HAMP domain-containing histidine kinase [Thalassotalea sp. LPB0316]|uniref:sensor histidine kinase n=1 Tax=Thalassotalea sp. LPB0316 TaxID=2769490 RepID=UPI001866F469|nr:ATP-binding protein [Thalassotalea sp. LPB0316]QOL26041.1 HAMP domain-containing histidine kinase [Thalassotalea sp. LPB0316]
MSTLAFASYWYINHHKFQLAKSFESIANIIGERSVDFLVANQGEELTQDLKRLDSLATVDQIFIFKVNAQTNTDTIFSRYKKFKDAPTFKVNLEEIKKLTKTTFQGDTIEYAKPIYLNENLLGYVYLHGNISDVTITNRNIMLMLAVLVFLSVVTSLIVGFLLLKKIRRPLSVISDSIIDVTQKKDYSQKCPTQPFAEAQILTNNLNLLYERTDKLIKKHIGNAKQLKEQNQELENKVVSRTDALKESNSELLSTLEQLHQYQEQLVENEKMASLGDLVAGVAHEVNTPIGLGVTASTLMIDKLEGLKAEFKNKTLKPSQLDKYIEESEENLQIIIRNLDRAANLISSFKQVAVDQSVEDERDFNMKQLIDDVFLTLTPKIKNYQYQLAVTCDENLMIRSKPSPITQVLINLIINSFIHGFENIDNGQITIIVRASDDRLTITYSDDGNGVKPEMQDKIFEPFSTTKRGEGGSGLGMHLVYNLVTQALKGTIQLDTTQEKGATFIIDFPIELLTKTE